MSGCSCDAQRKGFFNCRVTFCMTASTIKLSALKGKSFILQIERHQTLGGRKKSLQKMSLRVLGSFEVKWLWTTFSLHLMALDIWVLLLSHRFKTFPPPRKSSDSSKFFAGDSIKRQNKVLPMWFIWKKCFHVCSIIEFFLQSFS